MPSTSHEENPIVNYVACKPGKYSVKLIVTDAKGRRSSYQLKDYIEVKSNYRWYLREKKLEMGRDEKEE